MKLTRKFYGPVALFAALAAFFLACSAPGLAAVPAYLPYPGSDSFILNPYGENDEAAQLINAMQPLYRIAAGRSLAVEQMPGRGGATAWGALADKPGDGYTLAVTNLQSLILRSMLTRPVFRMSDLFNSNVMAEAPLVLWVPENSPFPNLGELVRSARAYPNQLIISGTGSGTQNHLTTLRLNFLAGIKTIYLPYIGASVAMEASKLGQAHAAWGLPLPDFGKRLGMRPLAVAAEQRLAHLPDVPTFEEAQIALFETAHFGLALPASTPPAARQAVGAYFGGIIVGKEFQEAVTQLGFTPKALNAQETAALIDAETERLRALLEQFNLE